MLFKGIQHRELAPRCANKKDTAEDVDCANSAGFFTVIQCAALAVFSDDCPALGMLKMCDQAKLSVFVF